MHAEAALLGLSTKNSPPNDQNACPPRLAAFSWSRINTRRPRSATSQAATSPPAPPDDDDISGLPRRPGRGFAHAATG
ncbi:hypothetical protein I552_2659 [Mycobacterium xenopi 3993]|nr:hypothetical protein I552_2659 [Mycobacterium xenopi 3993]